MAFLLGGANSASGGYEISNSLRFGVDTKLSFTQGTPTSRRIWTYSLWLKRSALGDIQASFLSFGNSDYFDLRFEDSSPNDRILIYISDGAGTDLRTSRLFRDPSAWYHIVIASDTTDGTAGDRTRIYVNGVEETSFDSENQPAQNFDYAGLESGDAMVVGNRYTGSHFFNGYIAEAHFVDGQQLTPSSFGETDEDSGIWKPKKYTGTYGTNGFFLEFKQTGTSQNSSGIGADTSGNDNHFAVTNLAATDVTTDTPTNNFCTMNSLTNSEATFSEGNTEIDHNGSAGRFIVSTFEVNKSKWYFEAKLLNYSGDSRPTIGLSQSHKSFKSTLVVASQGANGVYFLPESDTYQSNSATAITDVDTSPASNDIYHFAFDLDNLKFYIGKGNTWYHSSDPSAGSNGLAIAVSDYYGVATAANNTSSDSAANNDWQFNFGNPAFAISSSNADANGYGNFEYAVPSGFYALCTKNLAEFG